MKFDEIRDSIFAVVNTYEENYGIKTLSIECHFIKDNFAIFVAQKSDGSQTVFGARKGKRSDESSWSWFCPSEAEISYGFPTLCDVYRIINQSNEKNRRKIS